jgi:hypothetical protein
VRGVNPKALLCMPLGHRWSEAADVEAPYPVLRCERCGRTMELTAETHDAVPWEGRMPSPQGTWSGRTGPDGRPE